MKSRPITKVLADLFPPSERWPVAVVFGFSLLAAFFEAVGVVSILPFMVLVMDPSKINDYPSLKRIIEFAGATSPKGSLLVLGTAMVALLALGNAVGALNVRVLQRFIARTITRLSASLLAGYMRQPYAFHVVRDSASLTKIVLVDVRVVVYGVISPSVLLLSRGLMSVGLLSFLVVRDPIVALSVGLVLGVTHWLVFHIVQAKLHRVGIEYNRYTLERHRILAEALGGVKDLQVLGRVGNVSRRFETTSDLSARAEEWNVLAGTLPRYLMESVAFGGILLLTLALIGGAEGTAQALVPVLALYVFVGYRLLPALQQVFTSVASIRFNYPVLRGLHEDFTLVAGIHEATDGPAVADGELEFKDSIRLQGITFTYEGAPTASLRNVDLTIRRNHSIGLVGRSGAGKTTLADLILGLYEPASGTITVDGIRLTRGTIPAWRRRVGYVPQHVFLANASVAENIAFGLPPEEIDLAAIRKAAQLAQVEKFIASLPEGLDTLVGERGVKLSGGERQRIGIARALYHDPNVLVFDEATSALDGLTEDAVMEAIHSMSGERTVILIAHRLRTVEACERIVVLEKGAIVAEGAYSELVESSKEFRKFLGLDASVNA